MASHDSDQNRLTRLPAWAGYLLIALDVMRRAVFLVPWLGTIAALAIAMPIETRWGQAGVLLLMSILTFVGIMHACMSRASQQGELDGWMVHLALETRFGRWLVRRLKRSGGR